VWSTEVSDRGYASLIGGVKDGSDPIPRYSAKEPGGAVVCRTCCDVYHHLIQSFPIPPVIQINQHTYTESACTSLVKQP
jgi:hypothetical protein